MTRRFAALAALAASILVLFASACSVDQPASASAPSTSASPSTPTAEPTPEATASEEPSEAPTEEPSEEPTEDSQPVACQFAEPKARLLSSGWSLVMASRGASDHEEMADNFYDAAKDFSDDVKDDCEGELAVAATGLTFEAALVNAGVTISGEAESKNYKSARKAGEHLYDVLGITDDKWGTNPYS